MKLSYLWITGIALSFIACKKDKQSFTPANVVEENDYTICSVEKWTTNISSENIQFNFSFVVDNKFYSVKNSDGNVPGDDIIHIYDGSSWTTKPSSIPMGTNHHNFSFSIGSKGYAAVCFTNSPNRFYEYNPVTNVWTRKADFPGEGTSGFATFTINNKAYVVGGKDNGDYTNKTWEYNQATNTWRERKNLVLNRADAIGFSIGNNGYITNGTFPTNIGYYSSLVEYNPSTDTWTEKADFPGTGRKYSQCFVMDNKAYIGGGMGDYDQYNDFYKYNPANNTWVRIATPPISSALIGTSFTINSQGYMGYGGNNPKLARYTPIICATIVTGPTTN